MSEWISNLKRHCIYVTFYGNWVLQNPNTEFKCLSILQALNFHIRKAMSSEVQHSVARFHIKTVVMNHIMSVNKLRFKNLGQR